MDIPHSHPGCLKLVSCSYATHCINIREDDLVFFASGQDHVLFQRTDRPGELLIFKRSHPADKQTLPCLVEAAERMENVYEQVLSQLFAPLQKYRFERRAMQILAVTECIYECLESMANTNQQGTSSSDQISIDRNYRTVYLAESIINTKLYNTIVEFKPKTILPDRYSRITLEEIAQKHGLTRQDIQQILLTGDPVEKLRWYKTDQLGKKGKKINMNPLYTYNVVGSSSPIKFTTTKCHKTLPQLTEDQAQLLEATIFEEVHKDVELLGALLRLQSLFPFSPEFISMNTFHLVPLQEQLKKELIEVIGASLANQETVALSEFESYLKECDCLSKQPPTQWSSHCSLLLFLISLTWKDISLVFMSQFDGYAFRNCRIRIIDDYLKSHEKVQSNIRKDKLLLSKYIEHKLSERTKSAKIN